MKTGYALFFLILLTSCGNGYKLATEDYVDVRNYDIYTFRLCENIDVVGNERFFLCDEDCIDRPRAIETLQNTQVREEIYLLVSRTTNEVIYLTTKTDRSFDKTPDIFNTPAHNDYILANDLENVYFGQKRDEKLMFFCKEETLTLYINTKIKSCKITLESVLSQTVEDIPINNKNITISNIYNVPVEFNLSKRVLAIKIGKTENYEIINSIELKNGKIRYKGNVIEINSSQRRRLKYHPNFESNQKTIELID